ncbi:MAG: hypothetical protein H6760_05170 [Candidatus Nomurabacteria bacterium]|nr:MAG: hypothetical protein H6760_05170 [Candidatus Nomurabacteria bacterium]
MSHQPPLCRFALTTGTGAHDLQSVFGDYQEYEMNPPTGGNVFVQVFRVGDIPIAHVNRHGYGRTLKSGHYILPQFIDHRIYIAALAKIGVRRIIGTSLVGGVADKTYIGQVVLPNQCITPCFGRLSFAEPDDGPEFFGDMPNPFSVMLHHEVSNHLTQQGIGWRDFGTLEVIRGPKFETRADVKRMRALGVTIAGMLTVLPEAFLGRELGMAVTPVCLITDKPDEGTTQDKVIGVASEKMPRILHAIKGALPELAKLSDDDLPLAIPSLMRRLHLS